MNPYANKTLRNIFRPLEINDAELHKLSIQGGLNIPAYMIITLLKSNHNNLNEFQIALSETLMSSLLNGILIANGHEFRIKKIEDTVSAIQKIFDYSSANIKSLLVLGASSYRYKYFPTEKKINTYLNVLSEGIRIQHHHKIPFKEINYQNGLYMRRLSNQAEKKQAS